MAHPQYQMLHVYYNICTIFATHIQILCLDLMAGCAMRELEQTMIEWQDEKLKASWKYFSYSSLKQMIIYRMVCNVCSWLSGTLYNRVLCFCSSAAVWYAEIYSYVRHTAASNALIRAHTYTSNGCLCRELSEKYFIGIEFFFLGFSGLSAGPIGNRSKMDLVTPTKLIKFPYYSYYITQKLS